MSGNNLAEGSNPSEAQMSGAEVIAQSLKTQVLGTLLRKPAGPSRCLRNGGNGGGWQQRGLREVFLLPSQKGAVGLGALALFLCSWPPGRELHVWHRRHSSD